MLKYINRMSTEVLSCPNNVIPEPCQNGMIEKWITNDMKKLVVALTGSKYSIKYSVELTPPNYDDNYHIHGPCGSVRPTVSPSCDTKYLTLKLTFTTDKITDKLKIGLDKLSNSRSDTGKELKAWCGYQNTNEVPYQIGYYKKPGFDIVYQGLKVMIPHMTEKQFAFICWKEHEIGHYNEYLVEPKTYVGDKNCVWNETSSKQVSTGSYTVEIQLLNCDIDSNIAILKSTLVE
jgi:hypothetical protein